MERLDSSTGGSSEVSVEVVLNTQCGRNRPPVFGG
jgi:hypothetical protein